MVGLSVAGCFNDYLGQVAVPLHKVIWKRERESIRQL